MGEFIEHCVIDVAVTCLREAHRVLVDNGRLCLTFPRDGREKKGQHPDPLLIEWSPGITSWHQTVWTEDILSDLFAGSGFAEVSRLPLDYGFAFGLGVTLHKLT